MLRGRRCHFLTFFTLSTLLPASRAASTCATSPIMSTPMLPLEAVAVDSGGVMKSLEDEREYRHITLENGLKALLVSDPETDKAAAAMSVGVGHFSDPAELPGLAHFLEHMLFLGTETYPDENSYSAFLAAHGGSSNAYTATEETNFYFDVTHPHLAEALDRFSSFFTCPLLTESATSRELQAVESEHAKNVQTDGWRFYQLQKSLSDSEHPFSKFGTGNRATLETTPAEEGVDVRAALLAFHQKHYSANLMRLVILGREPLDTLQEWATARFSAIRNTAAERPSWVGGPYSTLLGKRLRIKPVREMRRVVINCPLPAQKAVWREKPTRYLSHLLGHEGKGSILSLLKERNWADGLSAGLHQSTSSFALFAVSIDATELGMQHVDEIVSTVFSYVAMLLAATPQAWIYSEVSNVAATNFRFKGKENPGGYVTSLASDLFDYDAPDALLGARLLQRFDADLVAETTALLSADNVFVEVINCAFTADELAGRETWYGTEHDVTPLSEETLAAWRSAPLLDELALPAENAFIATNFDVKAVEEGQSAYPALLVDTPLTRLWHQQDTLFRKPRLNVYCKLVSPMAYSSPVNAALTGLYQNLVTEALNEFAYDADIAGLRYDLHEALDGMLFYLRGYSHKLPVLLKSIMETMRSLEVTEDAFQRVKDKYMRQLRNQEKNQPYQHAMHYTNAALHQLWMYSEREEAAADLTLADVVAFADRLLARMSFELLVHGNATPQDARELTEAVEATLGSKPLYAAEHSSLRAVRLPAGEETRLTLDCPNEEDLNSALQMWLQVDMDDVDLSARMSVVAQLLKEPFFDQLRTKEQLGYLVFSGTLSVRHVLGVRFILQSAKKDASYMDDRIERFLDQQFLPALLELTDEQWRSYIDAVVAMKLEKPKRLSQLTNRFFGEIAGRGYRFDRREVEAGIVSSLSKDDIIAFWKERFARGAPLRRKIAVHVIGASHRDGGKVDEAGPEEETTPAKADAEAEADAGADAKADAGAAAEAEADIATEDEIEWEPLPPPSIMLTVADLPDFKRTLPMFPSRSRTVPKL
eukprot:PLAT9806.1.p1 GENE.PLAT9806.1~~PLAT9806.1.p1  ORF type:complete len:1049 (+),score=595.91 PLAT9806.1:117-3263(+)